MGSVAEDRGAARTLIMGPCPLFAGRDLELRALSATAASAAASGARLVLVSGEAGSGKSRLVREFLASLPDDWAREIVGTNRTAGTPESALDSLLELGEPRPTDTALADVIGRRAGTGPVALAVEDLHWLDPVVAEAMPEVLTRLGRRPVLLLGTYRLGAHALGSRHLRALAGALRHPAAVELRLGPLTLAAATEMAAAMGSAAPERDAVRAHARTGGNAYFLEELLRTPSDELPWTVAELVHERIDALSVPARRLATLLACAGEPVPRSMLDAADDELAAAAPELLHAGIAEPVDERGRAVGLRHAIVADALLHLTTPRERSEHHRLLATLLEAIGGAPARLARHWHLAGEPERAAPLAVLGADRLSGQGAYSAATELYEIAIAGSRPATAADAALLERAAGAAAMAERLDLGRAWVRQARSIDPGAHTTDAVMSDLVNTALFRLTDGSPRDHGAADAEAASSLLSRTADAVRRGDHALGQRLAKQAHAAAATAGDDAVAAAAALALANAGDPDASAALLEALHLELLERGADAAAARTLMSKARPVWMSGDGAAAVAVARRSEALAVRCDDPLVGAHVRGGLALLLAACGELAEAADVAESLLTLEDPLVTGIAQAVRAIVALERDELDVAAEMLAPLVVAVDVMKVEFFTVTVLGIAARLALVRGDPSDVLALLTRAEHRAWSRVHEFAADHAELRGRAELALGDVDAARRTALFARDLAHHRSGPGATAVADLLEGLVAAAAGQLDEAAVRVERAAHGFENAGRWPQAATAWGDAADLARAAGRPSVRSAALLERGSALVRRWGLTAVGRQLAAVSQRRTAADGGVPDVLAPLSPREREMVLLVAGGCSNREIAARLFISEKTVRNALSTALAKLGVHRRTEVAPLLATRS